MEDNDELKLSKEDEARLISVMEEGERVCQTEYAGGEENLLF